MQQISLDDKHDLAIDGNEVWIIDYSGDLHNPTHGPSQCFNFGKFSNVIKLEAIGPTQVVIKFMTNDNQIRTIHAYINDDFIAFADLDAPLGRHIDGTPATKDDLLRIEQEYINKLEDLKLSKRRKIEALMSPDQP
jgi:hypothetical protein